MQAAPQQTAPPTARAALPLAPFLVIACLATLTWLALSIACSSLEFAPRLRAADALWGWVAIALLQISIARPDESPWLRRTIALILAGGAALSALQAIRLDLAAWRTGVPQTEAVLLALAALLSLARGIASLSGRPARVADLYSLMAIQWLLVWAAAHVLLTWRQQTTVLILPRQILAILTELSLLAVGAHAALGLALAHLPASLGATIRHRAALVTLIAYNLGLVTLAVNWISAFGSPWLAYPLMLFGVFFYLVAMAGLLQSSRKLIPLAVLLGAFLLAAAIVMRPFDTVASAPWRHAAAGGCLGLATALALALVSLRLPPPWRPTRLVSTALILYLTGVVARVAIELVEPLHPPIHPAAALGSVLEIAGLVLIGLSALRAAQVARRLPPGQTP